jgi:lysine biosynthesis protein LysW
MNGEGHCPKCGSAVHWEGELLVGETLVCPFCHVRLVLVSLDPSVLRLARDTVGDSKLPSNR